MGSTKKHRKRHTKAPVQQVAPIQCGSIHYEWLRNLLRQLKEWIRNLQFSGTLSHILDILGILWKEESPEFASTKKKIFLGLPVSLLYLVWEVLDICKDGLTPWDRVKESVNVGTIAYSMKQYFMPIWEKYDQKHRFEQGHMDNTITVSINYLDGDPNTDKLKLKYRTLDSPDASQVFNEPAVLNLVKSLREEADSVGRADHYLPLDLRKKAHHRILICIQNYVSRFSQQDFIKKSMRIPVKEQKYAFGITYEQFQQKSDSTTTFPIKKLRILIISLDDLSSIYKHGQKPLKPENYEQQFGELRWETLSQLAIKWFGSKYWEPSNPPLWAKKLQSLEMARPTGVPPATVSDLIPNDDINKEGWRSMNSVSLMAAI